MKIQTATEMIKHKAVENKVKELENILDLISMASGVPIEDIRFDIEDWCGNGVCLRINIDEWSFDIDGMGFQEWCVKNCKGDFNSDKWFTIEGVKVEPTNSATWNMMNAENSKEVA
tara:strand:- start:170 stop:517 length:348 start_codon:yes stop_codon:yes gene_type:complete